MEKNLILTTPSNEQEFEKYYDLRWRILRKPWDQPKESEKDNLENRSFHLMICRIEDRIPLAIGRIHFNSPEEAQVRFMAVEEGWNGKGLGSIVLTNLEKYAKENNAAYIILNSRDTAIPFYEKHGYYRVEKTITLFGAIPHHVMRKDL